MALEKCALVTGITGQDGSYLAELLLSKGYIVHGVVRRNSSLNRERLNFLFTDTAQTNERSPILHYGDMTDSSNINRLLEKIQPDEIYNLAAQSHVKVSFDVPEYTAEVDGLGVLRLVDAIRDTQIPTKLYQASTSELFGAVNEIPQTEQTRFHPRSPYAVAKLFAYWTIVNYREAYGIYASNGILFNHESPRRGENFVTRKITLSAARIQAGFQKTLKLGNLDAKRDWGYAVDYVEGMWRILQQNKPGDYVLATGQAKTVRQFAEAAFREVGIDLRWVGNGLEEQAIDKDTGAVRVVVDPIYFRPTEVEILVGDYSKAKAELGWEPQIGFDQLVKLMVKADVRMISGEEIENHH